MKIKSIMKTLLTIGYGNRKLSEFTQLLLSNEIEFLIDIRSNPYSRFRKEFNKSHLDEYLREKGITYIFMGDLLGGKPKNPKLYSEEKLDYEKVKCDPFYKEGISKLKQALKNNFRVTVMCAELDPRQCHRYTLVGNSIFEEGFDVNHFEKDGALITHQDLRGLF